MPQPRAMAPRPTAGGAGADTEEGTPPEDAAAPIAEAEAGVAPTPAAVARSDAAPPAEAEAPRKPDPNADPIPEPEPAAEPDPGLNLDPDPEPEPVPQPAPAPRRMPPAARSSTTRCAGAPATGAAALPDLLGLPSDPFADLQPSPTRRAAGPPRSGLICKYGLL